VYKLRRCWMMIHPNTDIRGTGSGWVGMVMLIVRFVATKPAKQCTFNAQIRMFGGPQVLTWFQNIFFYSVNIKPKYKQLQRVWNDIFLVRKFASLVVHQCAKWNWIYWQSSEGANSVWGQNFPLTMTRQGWCYRIGFVRGELKSSPFSLLRGLYLKF